MASVVSHMPTPKAEAVHHKYQEHLTPRLVTKSTIGPASPHLSICPFFSTPCISPACTPASAPREHGAPATWMTPAHDSVSHMTARNPYHASPCLKRKKQPRCHFLAVRVPRCAAGAYLYGAYWWTSGPMRLAARETRLQAHVILDFTTG